MLGFKRKNLIALALAAIVAFTAFTAFNVRAADMIKADVKCNIKVIIPDASDKSNDDGTIANAISLYNGDVTVDFYKLADIELNGDIGLILDGVDLSKLKGSNVSAETIKSIANSAYEVVKDSEPNYTLKINPSKDKSKLLVEEGSTIERGVYLYVPEECHNGRYTFTSDKYLVTVPFSSTISNGTKVDEHGNIVNVEESDEWKYLAEIALKYDAKHEYGNLVIKKSLKTYNESLGTTPFVFNVEAEYEGAVVFSNVYSMDFSAPGTQSITINDVPAYTTVKVTEVYSGASYKNTVAENEVKTVEIGKDQTVTVSFENDYDNQLDVGTISIENHFNNEGFVDSNRN